MTKLRNRDGTAANQSELTQRGWWLLVSRLAVKVLREVYPPDPDEPDTPTPLFAFEAEPR